MLPMGMRITVSETAGEQKGWGRPPVGGLCCCADAGREVRESEEPAGEPMETVAMRVLTNESKAVTAPEDPVLMLAADASNCMDAVAREGVRNGALMLLLLLLLLASLVDALTKRVRRVDDIVRAESVLVTSPREFRASAAIAALLLEEEEEEEEEESKEESEEIPSVATRVAMILLPELSGEGSVLLFMPESAERRKMSVEFTRETEREDTAAASGDEEEKEEEEEEEKAY